MKRSMIASVSRPGQQRGIGAIVVLVVLVMLAGLAAALMRLSVSQSLGTAAAADLSRGLSTARSGVQWGAHQALKGPWGTCAGSTQTLDLTASTGMKVTVTCTSRLYNEGETSPGVTNTVRIYSINAVSCNGAAASCPDGASSGRTGYIERELRATFKK